MSKSNPPALEELIERLSKLPGLGRKTATRLALFFLRQPEEDVRALARALVEVKEKILICSVGQNIIEALLHRVEESGGSDENPRIRAVLLATGSSPEGEATSTYLAQRLKERGVTVTRLARGIPIGVDLEYVDGATLRQSFEFRREC